VGAGLGANTIVLVYLPAESPPQPTSIAIAEQMMVNLMMYLT